MKQNLLRGIALVIFLLFYALLHADIAYDVQFSGIEDQETLELLFETSDMVSKKGSPPLSETALRRRAESDVAHIKMVLQSRAYYSPRVDIFYDFESDPVVVTFNITEGPVYRLNSFKIVPDETLSTQDLNIEIGSPAYPADIIKAQDKTIKLLEKAGCIFALVRRRDVQADQNAHTIDVTIDIDVGERAFFGDVLIIGNATVSDSFILKQVQWSKGKLYDPCKVEGTLLRLENTGPFGSISITHGKELIDGKYVPMLIEVSEAKHKTFGVGVGYSTYMSFGVAAEWENRNFRGLGEKLALDTNLYVNKQEAALYYIKPGIKHPDQDLILQAEFDHEDVKAYNATSLTFSTLLERQLAPCARLSYGLQYKQLNDRDTDNNGSFSLVKFPILFSYSNVLDPLDPIEGFSVFLKSVPTGQVLGNAFYYNTNTLTISYYQPLTRDCRLVLAGKGLFGSILGEKRRTIPPSERFYAGSDTTLRGYNYLTVSPLGEDHDPIGGRSMMICSLEARYKVSDTWGAALFYDIGNVFESNVPQFDKKMLQSAGVGLRYFTPVAPLRFDIAFPLNRRKHVDSAFQLYFSIGQAF